MSASRRATASIRRASSTSGNAEPEELFGLPLQRAHGRVATLEHTESKQNLQASDLLKILTDDPDIKTIIAKKLQELNGNGGRCELFCGNAN